MPRGTLQNECQTRTKKFHKPFDLWNSFDAEREGFEPPVPLGTAVFKTAVIDHSTTFPIVLSRCRQPLSLDCGAKVRIIFNNANF